MISFLTSLEFVDLLFRLTLNRSKLEDDFMLDLWGKTWQTSVATFTVLSYLGSLKSISVYFMDSLKHCSAANVMKVAMA